ncbi:GNAT family N-acetyltransferase [Legionella sp.]|uniref:GNAT family N-acetyltransferase n=1 Tax=Legionella sp. TaxID=459 RepID=UPI003C86B798
MPEISIIPLIKDEEIALRTFALDIQNNEFKLNLKAEEQPDLLEPLYFYSDGGFWIAKQGTEIVGSIGLQKLNSETGIMRKFFVKKELRGTIPSVAALLFQQFLQQTKELKLKNIFLDTPAVAVASHRFYEKNGFLPVNNYKNLPNGYFFADRDSKVYCLTL